MPRIAYEDIFRDVRALLAREIRLDEEQAHMAAARTAWAGILFGRHPRGLRILDAAGHGDAADRRLEGDRCGGDVTRLVRRRLGDLIVKALIARPLWSAGDAASLFHADPHAGNLFATPDGKLAILDWSLVGALSKADRVSLTQIVLGALTLDGSRIRAAIDALSQGRSDAAALQGTIDARVAQLGAGAWPGMSWVTSLLDEVALHARCRFEGDLLMFRKVLQTLDGVVADVSADLHPDRVLTLALLRTLAAEWTQRSYTLPLSRHFATHLSNLDLTQLFASAPLIGQRQLYGLGGGWLRTGRPALAD